MQVHAVAMSPEFFLTLTRSLLLANLSGVAKEEL